MTINNSLQKRETVTQPATTVGEYLGREKVRKWINGMIGSEREAQKFISSIISATATNPALQACEYSTIVSTALLANALNLSLSPSLGLAYMVPFEDKRNARTVATFVLGYKGYIQLAVRSGNYKKINVIAIKEGEFVKYDPLTEELYVNLIQDDEEREKAPTVGYYAFFELVNGFQKTLYWSKKKMLLHADKYSKAFSLNAVKGRETKYDKVSYADFEAGKVPEKDMWKYSSFWYKDFDSMAFKTMLRQLISKWGIMSIDMQSAYDSDTSAMQDNDDYAERTTVAPISSVIEDAREKTAPQDFDENAFFGDGQVDAETGEIKADGNAD